MLIEKNVWPLFSSPVYTANANGYVNKILDFDNLDKTQYNIFEKTNNMLSKNQNILLDLEFSAIKNHVNSAMNDYFYNVLSIDKSVKLKLTNSWIVIGYPHSVTPKHIHQNSIFSGVFYIKSERNAGDLILSTPLSSTTFLPPSISPTINQNNIFNTKLWAISPKNNDIIIFPSHVYHEVSENLSNQIRCCIAFNYYTVGAISDDLTEVLTLE